MLVVDSADADADADADVDDDGLDYDCNADDLRRSRRSHAVYDSGNDGSATSGCRCRRRGSTAVAALFLSTCCCEPDGSTCRWHSSTKSLALSCWKFV